MKRYKTYDQMTEVERRGIVRRAVEEAQVISPVYPSLWSQIKAVQLPDQFLVELKELRAGDEYWDHNLQKWDTARGDFPDLVRLVKVK